MPSYTLVRNTNTNTNTFIIRNKAHTCMRAGTNVKQVINVTIRALVRMRMRFSVNEDRTPLNCIAVYWFGLTDENPVTKQVTFNNDSCNRCALHMMSEPT